MLVQDVLTLKGDTVWTVRPAQTLLEALDMLTHYQIGALLVLDSEQGIQGILSERDILKQCHRHPQNWTELKVHAVMTKILHTLTRKDTIKEAMEMMTEKRIRHIPVVESGKLFGILSVGDMVKARLKDAEDENSFMRQYLEGA